MMTSEHS